MSDYIKELYYCGDDIPDKIRVKRLIELIGFNNAVDAGKSIIAPLLEAFYQPRKRNILKSKVNTSISILKLVLFK